MGFVFIALAVAGALAFAVIGGALSLLVLWPRLQTLEREVARLRMGLVPPELPAAAAPPVAPAPPVASAPQVAPAPRVAPGLPVAPGPHAPALARAESTATWEETVGSSWLNKIGVLVVVIGLALGLSYSFARVGPAGRVALGFAVSLSMLGGGLAVARRDRFRNYGHGLVAGGWAGTYFTTFAMHAVEAARIVESSLVGTVALSAVSAVMFLHSLGYRSQIVASLALIVVYATLATTPLTWFALVAVVPIAAAVLFVAAARGWASLTSLGIAATYALVSVRSVSGHGDGLDRTTLAPYVLLAVYWVVFEAADLVRLVRSRLDDGSAIQLFALNAIGLSGAAVLVLPMSEPRRLAGFTALMGLGYAASAFMRRRLTARQVGSVAVSIGPFTTFHAAVLMAALLFCWSAGARFDGTRVTTTWLLEAELLFATGILFGDARLRAIGSVGVGVAAVHVMGLVGSRPPLDWPFEMSGTTPAMLLVTAAIFLNREWLRRLGDAGFALERGSTWVGLALVAWIIWLETPDTWTAFGWLALGGLWIELGLRRSPEYRWQGYTIGLIGAWLMLNVFGAASRLTTAEIWGALGGGSALAMLMAGRLSRAVSGVSNGERRAATGLTSSVGVLLLGFFEWRVLPGDWLGPVLAASGYLFLVVGLDSSRWLLRWQGYALLAVGTARAIRPVVASAGTTTFETGGLVAGICLIYAATLTGRARVRASEAHVELIVRGVLSGFATLSAIWLVADEVRASFVTLAWGLIGLALLVVGFPTRERILRVSGLALFAVCIAKLFLYDLSELETLARIMSFVVLGLVLLGVSWVYTRGRRRI